MDLNNKNIPIRKKWGQNFLIDRNIIRKIIKLINPESNDIVIEIGPGKVLTGLIKRISSKFTLHNFNNIKDIEALNNVV